MSYQVYTVAYRPVGWTSAVVPSKKDLFVAGSPEQAMADAATQWNDDPTSSFSYSRLTPEWLVRQRCYMGRGEHSKVEEDGLEDRVYLECHLVDYDHDQAPAGIQLSKLIDAYEKAKDLNLEAL
jgi:hypothetical protein